VYEDAAVAASKRTADECINAVSVFHDTGMMGAEVIHQPDELPLLLGAQDRGSCGRGLRLAHRGRTLRRWL